jgi:AcrR family transcriptional regulator
MVSAGEISTNEADSPDGRDLTSRARIRNAALHRFSASGFTGTPLRSIASDAGVAIGLISHHFGSKDGLREAVESWIVGLFSAAIERADSSAEGHIAEAALRDVSVAQMLTDNPLVVNYLRRELLELRTGRTLITRLAELSLESVDLMRATGRASLERDRAEQVVAVMVRQLGRLFLQPLIDQIVDSFPEEDRPLARPELSVEVHPPR